MAIQSKAQLLQQSGIFDSNKSSTTNTKPKKQLWLNIGVNVPIQNNDGETVDTFISIVGTPIDDILVVDKTSTKSDYFNRIRAIKNVLIKELISATESLEKGDSTILDLLEVNLVKAGGDKPEIDTSEESEEAIRQMLYGLKSKT